MAYADKEYLKGLIPKDIPRGLDVLKEGVELGPNYKVGRSRLVRESPYDSYLEFFKSQAEKNKIAWTTNVGLATVEEHVRGIGEIHDWCERLGINYNFTISIPSTLLAVPKELRNYGSKNTSYVPETTADFRALEDIRGMEVIQGDQVLFVPNAWETASGALQAGSSQIGCISQLMWSHPGCDEHLKYLLDTVKFMGILSTKQEEGVFVGGYLDDTYPSYCKDAVAYVAYALFEQYVVSTLCGVRYATAYGGLISDVRLKSALLKALYDALYIEERPPVLFAHANTTRFWDHDVEANYGMLAQEMLMAVLAERRYRTGAMIVPVPITEKVCVPTVESIKNVLGVSARLLENVDQWESVVDFSKIDNMAESLKEDGIKMFEHMLDVLEDAGLDIEDPLQMMMFIKKFNAGLFEDTFSIKHKKGSSAKARFYTDMGRITHEMVEEQIENIKKNNMENVLEGKKVLIASTDAHVYGIQYVRDVLSAAGADVVDGGVDSSIQYIFDVADEEGIRYVGISTHNGQALGIADEVVQEIKKREATYVVFLGGVLNTILPGHSEPTDVQDKIYEKGLFANNNILETIRMLAGS